jgi:hypothetical protein
MKRPHLHPVRLAVALAAFALNLLFVAQRPAPVRVPCEKDSAANVPAPRAADAGATRTTPAQTTCGNPEETDAGPQRVSQQEVINVPGVGRVRVSARETGIETRLVFEDAGSGKELRSVTMASDAVKPSLRFKVMHLKGLPDPLIVGVAVSPGGSDSSWEATAFGAVGGELADVTGFEMRQAGDRGGFYFGDLGLGLGPGAAVWNDVWDLDYEGHPSPHRYEITLYRWSRGNERFEWERVFRTPGKFDSGERALRSVGLRFKDVRRGIPDFSYLGEND